MALQAQVQQRERGESFSPDASPHVRSSRALVW